MSALCLSYSLTAAEVSRAMSNVKHKDQKYIQRDALVSQFIVLINNNKLAEAYTFLNESKSNIAKYIIGQIDAIGTANTHKMRWNLLHIACQANDLRMAQMLSMKYPKLFEQRDVLGRIPLFYALITGKVDLCNYFLKKINLDELIGTADYALITSTPGNYWAD